MALPFTAPTIGLAEVASVADTPHAKPGVNVPVRAPVVGSIVMSTTEPSWLLHVDRPVGTVWAASVNVGAGVEVVGGCPGAGAMVVGDCVGTGLGIIGDWAVVSP